MNRGLRSLVLRRRAASAGLGVLALLAGPRGMAQNVRLPPPASREGYVARLLINEAPFPGERGWKSEADSKAAMEQILLVLDARRRHVPQPYTRRQIAATESPDIIDLITIGGEKGQVDGFYRDAKGNPVMVSRVHERLAYLSKIGNEGSPGKFARLLNHAGAIATEYFRDPDAFRDRYEAIHRIQSTDVTGRGYSWMTDHHSFHPGGNFVTIPNEMQGGLGGNRFYTLRENPR